MSVRAENGRLRMRVLLGTDVPLKLVIVGRRWHQNARTDTLSVDLATDTHVSCPIFILFTVTCGVCE